MSNILIASATTSCPLDEPTSYWKECYGSGKLSNGEIYEGIWIARQPKGSSSAQSSENPNTKGPGNRPKGELEFAKYQAYGNLGERMSSLFARCVLLAQLPLCQSRVAPVALRTAPLDFPVLVTLSC
jgi:hypothetical protein